MLRQPEQPCRSPWSPAFLFGAAVVLAVVGVVLLLTARVPDDPVRASVPLATGPVVVQPASGSDTTDQAAPDPATDRAEPISDHAPQSVTSGPPVRVLVEAIDVDAPVVPLGLDPDGRLEVPDDFSAAGWWRGGAEPGMPGPTVVVGHVDSYQGPAVFHRLRDLEAGDDVVVTLDGGESLSYRVTGVQEVPKDHFPTQAVYGHTPAPTLRLLTCGGPFDRTTGHYRHNLIVYADLS